MQQHILRLGFKFQPDTQFHICVKADTTSRSLKCSKTLKAVLGNAKANATAIYKIGVIHHCH